jgi:hypothetical protein
MISSTGLLSTGSKSKCKSSNQLKNTRTGIRWGGTPDISHILIIIGLNLYYVWIQSQNFNPETSERLGYFVGFADNVEYALTFKILKMTWSQFYIEVW